MRKNSFCGLVMLTALLVFVFIGCDTDNGNDDTYAIGDTGPAGGTVFYDKGSYSDGWRYLEATPDVPEFYETTEKYKYSFISTNWFSNSDHANDSIEGTSTAIGSGKRNTEIIVAYFSSVGVSGTYNDGIIMAPKLCADLSYGGKTNWFLPSKYELNQMYLNLKGYHAVRDNIFWSSSLADSGQVWVQDLNDGTQFTNPRGWERSVRAVRYF
jgi:hypothetical protein